MSIIKQKYFTPLSHITAKKYFKSQKTDYEYLSSQSQGSYFYYLNRKPRSVYLKDVNRLIKYGITTNSKEIVDKGVFKRDMLLRRETIPNLDQVIVPPNQMYQPTYISLIYSHGTPILYPQEYLEFIVQLYKMSLKLPTYYINSYGVYHADSKSHHLHLVLYQNEKYFERFPITHKNAKFYLNKKQLSHTKTILNYQDKLNLSIVLKVTKELIITKLIEVIKSWNITDNSRARAFLKLSPLKKFTVKLLTNLLPQQFLKDNLPEQTNTLEILKELKQFIFRHRNVSGPIIQPGHNSFDTLLKKNNKLVNIKGWSVGILMKKYQEMLPNSLNDYYYGLIELIQKNKISGNKEQYIPFEPTSTYSHLKDKRESVIVNIEK